MDKLKVFVIMAVYLIICGCTEEYAIYSRKDGVITIDPKTAHIISVETIPWKTGPAFKYTVTKGVQIGIRFPLLKDDDFDDMLENSGSNSWLVKVTREGGTGEKEIGQLYVPLSRVAKRAKREVKRMQNPTGYFNIYYLAAGPSSRFERFLCPAFGHNLVIKNAVLEERFKYIQQIVASPTINDSVGGRINEFSVRPPVINGGNTLDGRYYIEIALYDYQNKIRKSNFVRLLHDVAIKGETPIYIPGCQNFQIPPRPTEGPPREFHWNR